MSPSKDAVATPGAPGSAAILAERRNDDAADGVRALARLARQVEKALLTVDLTLPQFRVLSGLADGSNASSALAHRLAVSAPSVTAVVDGLVARGFVEREADTDDRRRLTLLLTPTGDATLRAADDAVRERFDAVAAHLDDPGAATAALATLAVWNEGLDRFREQHVAKSVKP